MDNIFGAIAAALKVPADEFIPTLKTEDGSYLPNAELERRLSDFIKERQSATRQDQHARATREVFSKFGKMVKAAGFTNPDGLESDALIQAAVEHFQAQAVGNTADPSALSDADLAKLPAVKKLVSAAKADAETNAAKIRADYEAKETTLSRNMLQKEGRTILAQKAAEMKVKLGDGDARAKKIAMLEKIIDWDSVGYDSAGRLVMMENGAPKTDGFTGTVLFADTLPEHFELFGFETGGAGANPPAGSGTGTAKTGSSILFQSEAAFTQAFTVETDGEKRLAMMKGWQEQQQKK